MLEVASRPLALRQTDDDENDEDHVAFTTAFLSLTPAFADPRLQEFPDRTFTCKSDEGKYATVEVYPARDFMIIDKGNGPKRYRITGFSAPINLHVTDEFGFPPKTPVFDLVVIGGDEGNGLPELQQSDDGRWTLTFAAYHWYACLPNEGPVAAGRRVDREARCDAPAGACAGPPLDLQKIEGDERCSLGASPKVLDVGDRRVHIVVT
jgi:hypothetical protein